MVDISLEKKEIKSLIYMLQSEDADNHTMAFETLKNIDINKFKGEIILMFKYGGHKIESWQENCLPAYQFLINVLKNKSLTSAQTLALIKSNKGSNNCIELFIEFFIRDMTRILENIGYDTKNFEINIKLKDNG